jgi:hypothetical protein
MSHFTVIKTQFSPLYEDILIRCLEIRGSPVQTRTVIRDDGGRRMEVPLSFQFAGDTWGFRLQPSGEALEFVGDVSRCRAVLRFLDTIRQDYAIALITRLALEKGYFVEFQEERADVCTMRFTQVA